MPGLTMLGTIHRDPEGKGLVSAWINRVSPDVIALEYSQYGYLYRTLLGERIREKIEAVVKEFESEGKAVDAPALGRLTAYVEQPHEFQAAGEYAGSHAIPLYLIDMDIFSWLNLRESEGLFDRENLKTLLRGEEGGQNSERALADLFFDHGLATFPYTREMFIRDRHMAGRLASLLDEGRYRSILHICGWRHLCDPARLYAELKPRKVFVHDRTLCL